jgi:hypothetical protein
MRWIGFIAVVAPAIAGCSTVPRTEDVTRKSTLAIVQQVRCEAKKAVMDIAYNYDNPAVDELNNPHPHSNNLYLNNNPYPYRKTLHRDKSDPYPVKIDYRTASVAYEFTFDITEDDNASADATWGLPYTLGGAFSLSANGKFNRNRNTNRNFKIVDSFEELYNTTCVPPQAENLIYPISGEIGIYEVVRTFIKLQQIQNPGAGEVFTFADTLKFTTTLSAGVQPKLVISPFTDRFRLAGASGDFNASRVDIHKVTVTMAGEKPRSASAKTLVTAPLGASLSRAARDLIGLQTNSSLVSTTLIQTGSNPKDRALLELDRQRIIELQNRTPNLLVGP